MRINSLSVKEPFKEWAAIVWMCRNQLGRRNITREQRDYLLSQEYEAQCKTVGGDGSNQYEKKEQLDENHQIAKGDTRAAIAKSHNISQYEVQKAVEFGRGLDAAEKVSPGIKAAHMAFKAESRGYSPASCSSMQSRTNSFNTVLEVFPFPLQYVLNLSA